MPRRFTFLAVGALLAGGAPAGLAVVRWVTAPEAGLAALARAVHHDLPTFIYVTVSTAVVFAAFGYVLGRQMDGLAGLSRTDPLTGLANTRAFDEGLKQEVSRARRYGTPLSLLIADVDRLKLINDRGGHAAGNLALRAVAGALWYGARRTDIVARIGGDEFAVIAPNTDAHHARALAERMCTLVSEPDHDGVTVSIGVATLDPQRPDAGALFEAADAALYEAKQRGRNRVA